VLAGQATCGSCADQAPLFAPAMKRVAFTDEEIKAHTIKSYRPGQE
jgi:hypothetical protein